MPAKLQLWLRKEISVCLGLAKDEYPSSLVKDIGRSGKLKALYTKKTNGGGLIIH